MKKVLGDEVKFFFDAERRLLSRCDVHRRRYALGNDQKVLIDDVVEADGV
jgi:hypothetical protein